MTEWRTIEGGRYEVSEDGQVRSSVLRKPLRLHLDRKGYWEVGLSLEAGWNRNYRVHRLVAKAFLDAPIDPDRWHVNHKDGNKQNNHYSNLEWITLAENTRHAAANGLWVRGSQRINTHLTEEDVSFIRQRFTQGVRVKDLAQEYGVSTAGMSNMIRGKTWAHVAQPVPYEGVRGSLSAESAAIIRRRFKDGISQAELARAFGVAPSTISTLLSGHTWSEDETVRPRKKHLTEADVRTILQRLADGATLNVLAAEYAVSASTISLIRTRKIWKHVTLD